MVKISSGIDKLDRLIDLYHIGDNVVWEIDAGVPFEHFVTAFIKESIRDNAPIIYISFNRSPQTITNELINVISDSQFVLVDCFTSGKGKDDETFMRFYNQQRSFKTVRFKNPSNTEEFKNQLNEIEDILPSGARYIFDSLTGMQDLWGNEEDTYKLFTYMCPRLYDLETVAYWILEKDAHSPIFRANIKHITQVVLELYLRREKIYIKAHKLSRRDLREIFKPHQVKIDNNDIDISSIDKPKQFHIGEVLKNIRTSMNMSQKDVAERLNVTPSFISQLEANQISPSINTLLELCNALNINPSLFFRDYLHNRPDSYSIIRSHKDLKSFDGYKEFFLITDERINIKRVVIARGAESIRHVSDCKQQEIIYLISGNVSVEIDGKIEILNTGDCLFMREPVPRRFINKGGDTAELLVVS